MEDETAAAETSLDSGRASSLAMGEHRALGSGNWTAEKLTLVGNFLAQVEKTDTCWIWRGTDRGAYGTFSPGGGQSPVKAHRFAYHHFVRPIYENLVIDHLCQNKRCVNPAHLELVTRAENTARAHRGRKSTRVRKQYRTVAVRLPPHVYDAIARRGQTEGRPVSSMIRKILIDEVAHP